MQEELKNDRIIVSEQLLKVIDFLVAAAPDFLWHQILYASDQHVLVLRAIEDTHDTLSRSNLVYAPPEIVRQLLLALFLERKPNASPGIYTGHNMTDSS